MQKEQPTVDGYSGLNIDASETLRIQSGNCDTEMTVYETARWLALVRGVEVIDKKARQLGIDLEKEKSWIKPLALQKYVDEETAACIAEVKNLVDGDGDTECTGVRSITDRISEVNKLVDGDTECTTL